MFNNKVGAIVIGGHFQGLGVIRALAEQGIQTILLDHVPSPARYSRFLQHYFKSPPILEHHQFYQFLVQLAIRKKIKGYVVYPTDDEAVLFLSKYKLKLEPYYRILTPAWQCVQYVYNKKNTYQLATQLGIPIPKTYYPKSLSDLEKFPLTFPVIIKPAVMRTFFRNTGKKVFRAIHQEELKEKYIMACSFLKKDEILIQEEIPEGYKNLYSFCPLYKKKQILAHIVARRVRQHPMDYGHASTFAETVSLEILKKLGSRFLSSIDYYGLCEVEFIQDPRDGKFKLLEVNPRIWGWHTLAKKAGVNLPYLVFQDMQGKEVNLNGYDIGVKWLRLITDIPTALSGMFTGRITLKEYVKSIIGKTEFAVFSLKDPLPFFAELFMLPYLWIQRGF